MKDKLTRSGKNLSFAPLSPFFLSSPSLSAMPTQFPTLPIIREYVKDKGWKIYKEDHDSVCMLFGPAADEMVDNYILLFHTRDLEADLRVVVRGCKNIPEERREKMAELVGRANYGLNHGCFKLDLSDGEIKFYTALDTENCTQADFKTILEYYAGIASSTWSQYLPGIKKVLLDANVNVSEAIREIENV